VKGGPAVPEPSAGADLITPPRGAAPSRRSLVLRTALGTAISLVALWLVFRTVDVGQALAILATASPAWIAVMAVAIAADMTTRAVRWRVLLRPVADVRLLRTFQYLTTGYAANNVLPARMGELVRAHYLGDREGVSRSTALGTIVVERVIDFTVLVAVAGGALVILGARGEIGSAVLVGVAVSAALVIGLAVALVGHRLPGAGRIIAAAERYPRVRALAATFRAGIAVAGRPRTLVPAVLLSLLAWTCTIVTFAAGAQAVGIELAWSQVALLAAGVNLVTAIPAGPGFVGTWELAAVRILATFGVAGDTAFAFALLVHVSTLGATTIVGAISYLRIGWLPPASALPARAVGPDPPSRQAAVESDPPGR
jgi:uncharacterized protein (TIRG00374 family)